MDLVCIDCKERICSNCALFGSHRGHDIKEETAILEEISLRSAALTSLAKDIGDAHAAKPDEAEVDSIVENYNQKSAALRK